jgi:hypothetical protein
MTGDVKYVFILKNAYEKAFCFQDLQVDVFMISRFHKLEIDKA